MSNTLEMKCNSFALEMHQERQRLLVNTHPPCQQCAIGDVTRRSA